MIGRRDLPVACHLTARRLTVRRIRTISLIAVLLALAACGGEAASTTAPAPAGTGTVATTTTAEATPAADDPATVGDEIAALYTRAYVDVAAVLADRPEPAAAVGVLSDLKESYVGQMVALGHRREALDAAGRAEVDARISSALMSLPSETFDAYSAAAADYASDPEAAALIADFNIIGQYANFDLLREQEPEEAARLGVG
jgi:hypothetical protein